MNSYVQKYFQPFGRMLLNDLVLRNVHDLSTIYHAYGEITTTIIETVSNIV